MFVPAVDPVNLAELVECKAQADTLEGRLFEKVYLDDGWQTIAPKIHVCNIGTQPGDNRHKSCPCR